ncbi:L-saccharopine oxidase [Fusarium oxysporum f. sp. albedinis]|nr:L-saccharopine oxidase [Fusarium oxysporum f. sp. albedinis]
MIVIVAGIAMFPHPHPSIMALVPTQSLDSGLAGPLEVVRGTVCMYALSAPTVDARLSTKLPARILNSAEVEVRTLGPWLYLKVVSSGLWRISLPTCSPLGQATPCHLRTTNVY